MKLQESSPAHSLFSGPQKATKRLHTCLPAAKSSGNCYAHWPNAPTPGQPQWPSSVFDGICRPPSLPPVCQVQPSLATTRTQPRAASVLTLPAPLAGAEGTVTSITALLS